MMSPMLRMMRDIIQLVSRMWGDGQDADEHDGSACGHASPRPSNAAARRQRQFALGCPPSPRLRRVRRSSLNLGRERRLEGPSASAKKTAATTTDATLIPPGLAAG